MPPMSEKQLIAQHAGFVERRFSMVKMKIGNRPLEEDQRQIRAVRIKAARRKYEVQ